MKVKCKERVQDKNNAEWYEANKEYDLPEERAKEVVAAYNGRYFEFVEEVKELKLVNEEVEIKLVEVEAPKKTTKKPVKKSAK